MTSYHPSNPTSPDAAKVRWLTVEDIRKMQRMRRTTVIEAMECGDLPFEQRGRIRYARLCDVITWEQKRLVGTNDDKPINIFDEFTDFL